MLPEGRAAAPRPGTFSPRGVLMGVSKGEDTSPATPNLSPSFSGLQEPSFHQHLSPHHHNQGRRGEPAAPPAAPPVLLQGGCVSSAPASHKPISPHKTQPCQAQQLSLAFNTPITTQDTFKPVTGMSCPSPRGTSAWEAHRTPSSR